MGSNLGILVGSAISATGLIKRRIMGEQDRKGRFGILEMTLMATMMAMIQKAPVPESIFSQAMDRSL